MTEKNFRCGDLRTRDEKLESRNNYREFYGGVRKKYEDMSVEQLYDTILDHAETIDQSIPFEVFCEKTGFKRPIEDVKDVEEEIKETEPVTYPCRLHPSITLTQDRNSSYFGKTCADCPRALEKATFGSQYRWTNTAVLNRLDLTYNKGDWIIFGRCRCCEPGVTVKLVLPVEAKYYGYVTKILGDVQYEIEFVSESYLVDKKETIQCFGDESLCIDDFVLADENKKIVFVWKNGKWCPVG